MRLFFNEMDLLCFGISRTKKDISQLDTLSTPRQRDPIFLDFCVSGERNVPKVLSDKSEIISLAPLPFHMVNSFLSWDRERWERERERQEAKSGFISNPPAESLRVYRNSYHHYCLYMVARGRKKQRSSIFPSDNCASNSRGKRLGGGSKAKIREQQWHTYMVTAVEILTTV